MRVPVGMEVIDPSAGHGCAVHMLRGRLATKKLELFESLTYPFQKVVWSVGHEASDMLTAFVIGDYCCYWVVHRAYLVMFCSRLLDIEADPIEDTPTFADPISLPQKGKYDGISADSSLVIAKLQPIIIPAMGSINNSLMKQPSTLI